MSCQIRRLIQKINKRVQLTARPPRFVPFAQSTVHAAIEGHHNYDSRSAKALDVAANCPLFPVSAPTNSTPPPFVAFSVQRRRSQSFFPRSASNILVSSYVYVLSLPSTIVGPSCSATGPSRNTGFVPRNLTLTITLSRLSDFRRCLLPRCRHQQSAYRTFLVHGIIFRSSTFDRLKVFVRHNTALICGPSQASPPSLISSDLRVSDCQSFFACSFGPALVEYSIMFVSAKVRREKDPNARLSDLRPTSSLNQGRPFIGISILLNYTFLCSTTFGSYGLLPRSTV